MSEHRDRDRLRPVRLRVPGRPLPRLRAAAGRGPAAPQRAARLLGADPARRHAARVPDRGRLLQRDGRLPRPERLGAGRAQGDVVPRHGPAAAEAAALAGLARASPRAGSPSSRRRSSGSPTTTSTECLELPGGQGFDWIADFAGRLPMDVISEMMGVPEADRDEVRRLADLVVHREDGVHDVPEAGMDAALDLVVYYADMLEQRKKQPTDDLTSALLAAELDGDRLTDEEIIALPVPDGRRRQRDDHQAARPRALPPDPPPRAARRGLRRPGRATGRPGRAVDRGDAALRHLQPDARAPPARRTSSCTARSRPPARSSLLLLGSANRDERVFAEPDDYDIFRDNDEVAQLLSFGGGRHFCLGANLARLEARIALRELVRRVGAGRGRPRRLSAGALGQRPRLRLGAGHGWARCADGASTPSPTAGRPWSPEPRPGSGPPPRSRSPPPATRLPWARAASDKLEEIAAAIRASRWRGDVARPRRHRRRLGDGVRRRPSSGELGDDRGRGLQRRRGRARHHPRGRHRAVRPRARPQPSSARTGWSARSCPAWSSAVAATSSSCPPTSPCGRARSCRPTPPASGASRAWRTRCRWSSRAPACAPRSCGPARPGARWAATGTSTTAAFVLNQWVKFGHARHPHFLKPQAIADAIARSSAPRAAST